MTSSERHWIIEEPKKRRNNGGELTSYCKNNGPRSRKSAQRLSFCPQSNPIRSFRGHRHRSVPTFLSIPSRALRETFKKVFIPIRRRRPREFVWIDRGKSLGTVFRKDDLEEIVISENGLVNGEFGEEACHAVLQFLAIYERICLCYVMLMCTLMLALELLIEVKWIDDWVARITVIRGEGEKALTLWDSTICMDLF